MTRESGEQVALLALCSIRGIGYATLTRIAKAGMSFAAFVGSSDGKFVSQALRDFGAKHESEGVFDWSAAQAGAIAQGKRLFNHLTETGTQLLIAGSNEFPASLSELPDSPAWIFVRGNASLLTTPSVTIVGGRHIRGDGMWLCRFVGLCFDNWKAPIITGLASNADFVVQELAARARIPTIAIQGSGILSETKSALCERIIHQGGAVVTEYLPYESSGPANFERLGRVKAALCRVLIPIDWKGRNSGGRAVQYAMKLNRPIAEVRLPDWTGPTALSKKTIEPNFTIPGQEKEFRLFVARSLQGTSPPPRASITTELKQQGLRTMRLGRGRPPRHAETPAGSSCRRVTE
jgi:DNA processing protein